MRLERTAGEVWKGRWSVVFRGTPHDQIVSELSRLGLLQRSTSVTPVEGGLGPGTYEAELFAIDRADAEASVRAALAGCDLAIERIEAV